MNYRYKYILNVISITFLLSIFLFSCEIINPFEKIPAYIHIDKFIFSVADTSSSGQGSRSNKISDAWVYVDDQIIGAFELPATIPILFNGTHKVTIRAGIKVNGIAATRGLYPYYSSYINDIDLVPGSTIVVQPTITYITSTVFAWIEDFEGSGFKISKSPHGTDTAVKATSIPSEVFEGLKSGVVNLDGTKTFFEGVSSTALNLPKNSSPVFLEMNYKCNQTFAVGVYSFNSNEALISLTLNASANWNKTYVNLTDAINTLGHNPPYTFFIGMAKDADTPLPVLFIDNLKILYQ